MPGNCINLEVQLYTWVRQQVRLQEYVHDKEFTCVQDEEFNIVNQ